MRNPLFGPQTDIKPSKLKGARYGLEVDVTGRGSWVEQGLYDTRREAETEGRRIKKREGMRYHVKATRDTRNPVTDRAKRYRAHQVEIPGRKMCTFCQSKKNIDIDHVTGDESDGGAANLIYLCRPCNTTKGIVQARHHIGVRTAQYNPRRHPNYEQFRQASMVLLGAPGDPVAATSIVYATAPEARAKYAEQAARENPFKSEAQRRKFYAMLGRGEISLKDLRHFASHHNPEYPTFAQYAHGVAEHRRGAHDEGGRIIHATPASVRSRYARQIGRIKRERRGEVPF